MTNASPVDRHWSALTVALERSRFAAPTVGRWGHQLADVLRHGGRLLACGNGGSAAEAQHLTGELVGKFVHDRMPLAAIALHADTSATTAIANDYGEDEVFARQVRAHGRLGDIFVGLSTSGRSSNVIAAAKAAAGCGMTTWALTGQAPNPLASLSDGAVAVPADHVATVQEMHLAIVHALCAVVDEALGVTG